MNRRIETTEQLARLAIVAGLALTCLAASPASAGFTGSGGASGSGTTISDPFDLKNPPPDEIDIWEEGDPTPGDIVPIGHIDIPELDTEDGKPKPTVPSPLFLPPLPGVDTGDDIFGDLTGDPNIDWYRDFIDQSPRIGEPPLSSSAVVVSTQGPGSVPAPGGIGVVGLGLLALNRRRRT
jgi:MYXO-CTERM domain-containing protein